MMGRIVSELADVAIVTSDNPRSEDPLAIIDEIVAGMDRRARRRARPGARRSSGRSSSRAAGRRRRDRRQGARARPGGRRRDHAVRRHRSGRRSAARAENDRMIPLSLDEVRELAPGRLRGRAVGDRGDAACRPTRAGSRRATSSSRSAAAPTSSSTPSRAGRRPRSSPTTPSPRWPRSPVGCATGARARFVAITGSMGKTSTKDILAAICVPQRRTDRRGAELQRRDRRAADDRPRRAATPSSASSSWRCVASARSPSSVRSRSPTSA